MKQQKILYIDRLENPDKLAKSPYAKSMGWLYLASKVATVLMKSDKEYKRSPGNMVKGIMFKSLDAHLEEYPTSPMNSSILNQVLGTRAIGIEALMIGGNLFQNNSGKKYLVTRGLTEILSRTKADIPAKMLPETFSAYIEVPGLTDMDGDIIKYMFVNIYKGMLHVAGVSVGSSAAGEGSFLFSTKLHPDKTLRQIMESAENSKFKREDALKTSGEEVTYTITPENEYLPYMHTIGNIIAFISNTSYVLEEEQNVLARNGKLRKTQLKTLTESTFIIVGKDFHGKKFTVDDAAVSGHWRWQPCGVGHTQVKLIYIEPHIRHYKTMKKELENHDTI